MGFSVSDVGKIAVVAAAIVAMMFAIAVAAHSTWSIFVIPIADAIAT